MIFDEGHEILAILPIKGVIEQRIMSVPGGDDRCTKELCEHKQAVCITKGRDGRIRTYKAGIDGLNYSAGVVGLLQGDPMVRQEGLAMKSRDSPAGKWL